MQWHIMLNLNKGNVLNPDITMMELAPLDIILMQSTPLLLDQCIVDTLSLLDSFKLGIKQIYYRVTSLESNFICHFFPIIAIDMGYVSYPKATNKLEARHKSFCFQHQLENSCPKILLEWRNMF